MKVISGIYKGRNIAGYNIKGTRPTMDRVKESLFASIQDYIRDSVVLDLFSGSGNLGIEALSEGAKYIYLCDNNNNACKTIKQNMTTIGIENYYLYQGDFKKCLEKLKTDNIKLDVIFLDPPYQTNYIERAVDLIVEYNLLNNNGIIICESDSISKINIPTNYKVLKEKKYGDKYIVIITKM